MASKASEDGKEAVVSQYGCLQNAVSIGGTVLERHCVVAVVAA